MKKFFTLLTLCGLTSGFVFASDTTSTTSEASAATDSNSQDDWNNPNSLASLQDKALTNINEACEHLTYAIETYEFILSLPGLTAQQFRTLRKNKHYIQCLSESLFNLGSAWDKDWTQNFPKAAQERDTYWDLYKNNREEWARQYPEDAEKYK